MSPRPPDTAAPPTVHPSVQEFLQAMDEATARHQRHERLQSLQQKRFAALKALVDCAHQIQRLPPPAPDRPSPGVDVEAWVRGPISTAADGLRALGVLLRQPLTPVLKVAIPHTYMEARKPAVKAMEELFIMLLEAKPQARRAVTQRVVDGLSAMVDANDGHAGAFAHWFEYAAFHLGSKLERIPLEALESESQIRDAAKLAFEDADLIDGARSGRGRRRTRDHLLGKHVDDAMRAGGHRTLRDACAARGIDPGAGIPACRAYQKRRSRQRKHAATGVPSARSAPK